MRGCMPRGRSSVLRLTLPLICPVFLKASMLLLHPRSVCSGCSAPDPIKTLYHIDFAFTPLNQGQRVKIWFYGSGFLKYQIRLMVGALSKVGQGKIPPESISQ